MGLDSRESISKPSTTGKCNNYTHGMRYFPLDKYILIYQNAGDISESSMDDTAGIGQML